MNRKKALSDTDREIIRKMADYNLTRSQVARDMFMHWNTVVFHCRSIKRITGVVTVFVACKTCRSRSGGYRFRWFDNDSYQRAEDRAVRSWNRRLRHG